jgi:sulfur carrier protein
MQIQINGKKQEITNENIHIEALLELLKVESPDMVSVQLNGEIIERESYISQQINNGDEVEFLYFMGGGS